MAKSIMACSWSSCKEIRLVNKVHKYLCTLNLQVPTFETYQNTQSLWHWESNTIHYKLVK